MTRRLAALASAYLALTGISMASELAPESEYSLHLGRFDGTLYYTVEQDGYRVVAPLASTAEEQPIRFVSMLRPGRRMTISVPQAVSQPPINLEILRDGEALMVGKPSADTRPGPLEEVRAPTNAI